MKTREEKLLEIATAIYPVCIDTIKTMLYQGRSCEEDNPQKAASKMAIRYADELLHQVHIYSRLSSEEKKEY